MKAVLIYQKKVLFEDGGKLEITMWRVPVSKEKPEGIKYSLVYIVGGQRVVGYDNAEGKGHHKHAGGAESPYYFRGEAGLLADFWTDVKKARSKR